MSLARSQQGFTLLELIVAISIMAILAAIAAPSFNTWRQQSHLKAQAREVFGAFQRAKSEAVTRNTTVTVTFEEGIGAAGKWEISDSIAKGEMISGVQISNVSFTDKKAGFNARGLPLEGGSVQVKNSHSTYSVKLSPAGSVTIGRI